MVRSKRKSQIPSAGCRNIEEYSKHAADIIQESIKNVAKIVETIIADAAQDGMPLRIHHFVFLLLPLDALLLHNSIIRLSHKESLDRLLPNSTGDL